MKCKTCNSENLIKRRILQINDTFQYRALCLDCGHSNTYRSGEGFETAFVWVSSQKLIQLGWGTWTEKELATYHKRKARFVKKYKCCQYCRSENRLQLDHKFPKLYGGNNKVSNLQLLCADCNNRKRDNLFIFD